MRTIILSILLCISIISIGQPAVETGCYTFFKEGQPAFVFADTAYIQNSLAYTASKKRLTAGTEVFILKKMDSLFEANNQTAAWYQISFVNQSKIDTGFIWGGDLSLENIHKGNTRFVYGLTTVRNDRNKKFRLDDALYPVYKGEIKAVANGKIIHRKSFTIANTQSVLYTGAIIQDNRKLSKVNSLIELHFSGGACMVPGYNFTYAWNGSKLIALPVTQEVGDEGYYQVERLIYPTDEGGKANMIVKEITEGASTENMDEDGKQVFDETKHKVYYKWDGSKATKITARKRAVK